MTNKKGLLSNVHMTAAYFSHFNGEVSFLYNYNIDLLTDAEVSFLNHNSVEFIPMFGSYYVQTQRRSSPTARPNPSGRNRRCYLWQSAIPTAPNNVYRGSSDCTLDDILTVLNATIGMLTVPVRRLALFNEPWPEAAFPEPVNESVAAYMAYFQPIATMLGLDLISATTQPGTKALSWDQPFLERHHRQRLSQCPDRAQIASHGSHSAPRALHGTHSAQIASHGSHSAPRALHGTHSAQTALHGTHPDQTALHGTHTVDSA
jgi:hypothetical protein